MGQEDSRRPAASQRPARGEGVDQGRIHGDCSGGKRPSLDRSKCIGKSFFRSIYVQALNFRRDIPPRDRCRAGRPVSLRIRCLLQQEFLECLGKNIFDRRSTPSDSTPYHIWSVERSPFRKRSTRARGYPWRSPTPPEDRSFESLREHTISPRSDVKREPCSRTRLPPAIPGTKAPASLTVHALSSEFISAAQLLSAHRKFSTSPSRTRTSRRKFAASITRHFMSPDTHSKKIQPSFSKNYGS
jgi:hypothetical protein